MGRGTSKMGGTASGMSAMPTNDKGQTEAQWEAYNRQTEQDFEKWLDSNDKKAFEADQYNVYEKMSLDEARKFLKPNSEKGYSYNDGDEVPDENYFYIEYGSGESLYLEPGDSLKGVRRTDINFVINENENTTAIYSKKGSSYIGIYNDATFSENNDIWRWERK